MTPRTMTTEARFWTKVEMPDGPDGCWPFTGAKNNTGYGVFGIDGNLTTGAHRYAYELLVGPIPEGLHLDHLCRVRHCVNPDHLEAVTQTENNRRAAALKTHCPQGHPYEGNNLYVSPRGDRMCRECMRSRTRAWRAERKAVA